MTSSSTQSGPDLAEAQLVQRAVAGDTDAFAKLYEAYVERIYRFIYFRVGVAEAAEDLTSQVFLKAWEGLSRYQPRGLPFGAWLFRVARNTVIDHYRASRPTVPLDTAALSQPDPAADVAEAVGRRLENDELRAALGKLTDEQRQVLSLKFLAGLSTDEVAQALGKKPGAVRALQMRGLQALARLMAVEDD